MEKYMATFDLNTRGQNYGRLYEVLLNMDAKRVLDFVWVFEKPDTTAEEVRDRFARFLGERDRLLVRRISKDDQFAFFNASNTAVLVDASQ